MTDQIPDIAALVATIETALEKATPGPWHIDQKPVTLAIRVRSGGYITENVRRLPNQAANADLIAHAPDWLRQAAAALTRLAQERDQSLAFMREAFDQRDEAKRKAVASLMTVAEFAAEDEALLRHRAEQAEARIATLEKELAEAREERDDNHGSNLDLLERIVTLEKELVEAREHGAEN